MNMMMIIMAVASIMPKKEEMEMVVKLAQLVKTAKLVVVT